MTTQWELVSVVEKRFRDAFVPTKEHKDIEAAVKSFLLSKKIVDWSSHKDVKKERYVVSKKPVFRIERTGIELINSS